MGKLGVVSSFCKKPQNPTHAHPRLSDFLSGLGAVPRLGRGSHKVFTTALSLRMFFTPLSNQFVGVSASRTFLSPFTKGTRVLALVIRFLNFCAQSIGFIIKQQNFVFYAWSLSLSFLFFILNLMIKKNVWELESNKVNHTTKKTAVLTAVIARRDRGGHTALALFCALSV